MRSPADAACGWFVHVSCVFAYGTCSRPLKITWHQNTPSCIFRDIPICCNRRLAEVYLLDSKMKEHYPDSRPDVAGDIRRPMQVDFMICGTQKGGTTALDSYLRCHESICMADEKECHYFDNDVYFPPEGPNYDQYHSFFRPTESTRIIGEATPVYMYWYDCPRRIWEYNRRCKIVVLLRNPIERAYSHWNMETSRGDETLAFFDAIVSEQERSRADLPHQHRIYSYVDRGFYLEQLRRLWFYFGCDNVLAIKSELLKAEPLSQLNRVCDFLGLDRFRSIEPQLVFAREYNSTIGATERRYLSDVYRYEIQSLEARLGWDCSDWLA